MSVPLAKTVKQKGSLNAKAKVKQTFKFVIKNPYSDYWPAITQDEISEFKTVINVLKTVENWKLTTQFGLTSILRSIKNSQQTLNFVAISLNFKPHFITKQVINLILSKSYKIHVILVENLEVMLKESFGFQSSSIAFKIMDGNTVLSEFMQKIDKNYRSPNFVKVVENKVPVNKTVKKPVKIDEDDFHCEDVYVKKFSTTNVRGFVPEKEFVDVTDRKVYKNMKTKRKRNDMIKFNTNNLYQDTFVVKVQKKNKTQ